MDQKEATENEARILNIDDSFDSNHSKEPDEDEDGENSSTSSSKWPLLYEKFVTKRKRKPGFSSSTSSKSQSPPTTTSSYSSSSVCSKENLTLDKENSEGLRVRDDAKLGSENKLGLDCELIRQRALERAKLKSDEELGLKIPHNIKRLIMPATANDLSNEPRRIEIVQTKDDRQFTREFESKTETDSEDEEVRRRAFIDENQTPQHDYQEIQEDLESQIKRNITAPLAKSETFENFDEDSALSFTFIPKQQNFFEHISIERSSSPVKKFDLKNKLSKFWSPSSSPRPKSPSPSPTVASSTSFTKRLSSGSGVFKTLFKSPTKSLNEKLPETNQTVRKLVLPYLSLDMSGNVVDSSSSSSSFVRCNSDLETGAFNTLNVTNSPRLVRNWRTAKATSKQRNEDKSKQERRTKRNQEIHTRLQEIDQKVDELEGRCVFLRNMIDLRRFDDREQLEKELLVVTHQRNLLNRFQTELNIQ